MIDLALVSMNEASSLRPDLGPPGLGARIGQVELVGKARRVNCYGIWGKRWAKASWRRSGNGEKPWLRHRQACSFSLVEPQGSHEAPGGMKV